jgi:NADH dehydrogenase FAD-containing subunit
MLEKPGLYARVAAYTVLLIWNEIKFLLSTAIIRKKAAWFGPAVPEERTRNIVIIGASFAGHYAVRLIANSLPPNSPFRVIVIEPSSHFVFTWVLPRFCVAKGHAHKAFIPYGGNIEGVPEGAVRWIQDKVVAVTKDSVQLKNSDEHIPYEYLIVATGSGVKDGLPSRVHETEKAEGVKRVQEMQQSIEKANRLVVVGGGAAGVEVATDAKSVYPNKSVTLIHSRSALMHRFGPGLQKAALEGMQKLGGDFILEDRLVGHDAEAGTVTLQSGKVLECDFLVSFLFRENRPCGAGVKVGNLLTGDYQINCTGQKPHSELIAQLSPSCISETGHIKIKPTLQIADDAYPNIYVCGEVADTKTPNPNARSASRQAWVVAANILKLVQGKKPTEKYENFWADGLIKLTLGLVRAAPGFSTLALLSLRLIFCNHRIAP